MKAVNKRDAYEKIGVIGKKNGRYNIVEYSELPV
jgi:UDP-N-acetylglucosamine pyrophosphorylase